MPPEIEATLEDEITQVSTEGADGQQPQADGNGADSSDAHGAPEDKDLLSVVRDAVQEKKPDSEAASPAKGDEDGDKPDPNAPKPRDDENFSDVPFNKHPRFRQLLTERNANRADAENFRKIDTFVRDSGMTSQEAADLLTVGAMAKTNPAKAWELARPWVESVLRAAGEVLTPDLDQMVRDGHMTREAAFEVSRSRASVKAAEVSRGFDEQRAERQRSTDHETSIRGAAQDWENGRRERDPNFDAKVEPILKEIAYRRMQGDVPTTPQAVKAQLDEVYKAVNAAMTPPAAPQATTQRPAAARPARTPVTGGSVAGNARPAPRNMLEVVQQAGASA